MTWPFKGDPPDGEMLSNMTSVSSIITGSEEVGNGAVPQESKVAVMDLMSPGLKKTFAEN